MSDFDTSRIDAAVREFRATMPSVLAPGFDAARSTVRRRRRARVAVFAAGVAVMTISAGIFAASSLRASATQPAQTGTTPVPGSTSSPSPTAAGSAHPTCGNAAGQQVPAGGIPFADLCEGTIDVPAWPGGAPSYCPTGPVTFTHGVHSIVSSAFLNLGNSALVSDSSLAYVDIDGDGDAETVVLLSCGGEEWASQVVALDRGSGGTIRTIGTVVQTSAAVPRLITVTPAAGGQIQVEVADFNSGLGGDGSHAQRQVRTYGYDGVRFTQTAGPTSFPPNPKLADVSVTTTPLTFGPLTGGQRTGTLTVTVHNAGPGTVAPTLTVQPPTFPLQFEPIDGCTVGVYPAITQMECTLSPLAGGASRDLTFVLHTAAGPETHHDNVPRAFVGVSAGSSDPVFDNNDFLFDVTFA